MHPASTKGGGTSMAFPDVCKTPAAPSPVPLPYPNLAQCAEASGSTCSQKVKIRNKPVLTRASEIPATHGDEPGTLKGVVSQTQGSTAKFKTSVAKVLVEGNEIVTHLATLGHNGSNANAPAGTQLVPSQMVVFVVP